MAFANDYVPVNERIEAFYAAHPEGSIQCEIHMLTDALVVMRATVYRDRDDPRPSVAHSMLGIPGKTNFTRGSEVENAETSAVGRAIAMLGFEVKRGMASREEVDNKSGAEPPAQTFRQRVDPETGEIHATAQAGGGAVSTHERPAGQSTGPNPGEMKAIQSWVTTNGGWTNAAILDALDTSAAAIGEHGPEVAIDAWWAAQDKPSVPAFKQAVGVAAKKLGGAA